MYALGTLSHSLIGGTVILGIVSVMAGFCALCVHKM